MNQSFYTGAVGASAQQQRLATIANNLANTNTTGYKEKKSDFVSLLYQEMNRQSADTPSLKAGVGARIEKSSTIFTGGSWQNTEQPMDFAVAGSGFFGVRNPATGEVSYTRDGSFHLSVQGDWMEVVTEEGFQVLGKDGRPVVVTDANENQMEERFGVYDFEHKEGMLSVGNNRFVPAEKNGQAFLQNESSVERGVLEASNVDVGKEFGRMIEAQRAYSYALQMVRTSDQVEEVIHNLR